MPEGTIYEAKNKPSPDTEFAANTHYYYLQCTDHEIEPQPRAARKGRSPEHSNARSGPAPLVVPPTRPGRSGGRRTAAPAGERHAAEPREAAVRWLDLRPPLPLSRVPCSPVRASLGWDLGARRSAAENTRAVPVRWHVARACPPGLAASRRVPRCRCLARAPPSPPGAAGAEGATPRAPEPASAKSRPAARGKGKGAGRKARRETPRGTLLFRVPTTGYMIFLNKQRSQLRATHPDLPFTEIMKMLAVQWAQLSQDKKGEMNSMTSTAGPPGSSSAPCATRRNLLQRQHLQRLSGEFKKDPATYSKHLEPLEEEEGQMRSSQRRKLRAPSPFRSDVRIQRGVLLLSTCVSCKSLSINC
ncbi:uncharacterized protein LOC117978774 [Pan paniscus]|uniref:uncharacterized protein LOC117978774 n=1 Tax=Pan paniscus TaxID=9597 RepID=UPI002436384C|nr:uncharacterized protein LOC117978774 [Pan paniscus]